MSHEDQSLAGHELNDDSAIEAQRISFVEHVEHDARVLMTLADPAERKAVATELSPTAMRATLDASLDDALEVLMLPSSSAAKQNAAQTPDKWPSWFVNGVTRGSQPSIVVKCRGAEVRWRPGRAVIQCAAEQRESLLLAVVDFSYYENELRRLEGEIAGSWSSLEHDKLLAYQVTPADLERNSLIGVGERMDQTLRRRIRHARIEPHLMGTGTHLSSAGRRLGDKLREKARTEDRLEAVDGHLDVFEYVYEMSSQRIGEFRASQQERTLEWIIIILLATETLILVIDILWRVEG